MDNVERLFCSELDDRGIEYTAQPDGLYEIRVDGQKLTISLENLRRNLDRDGDSEAIGRFVDNLGTDFFAEAPSWKDVQPLLRYSLEPSDYESGFDDVLTCEINEELIQVYVYVNADGSRITWVNHSTVNEWGVSEDQVKQQAEVNMSAIVGETDLQVEDIDGDSLGMLSTEETPFKASLILSPSFRDLVAEQLGWPVYVVVPCRDFAYVVRHDNPDFLGRLGGVVVKEFHESGYPITKDVLEVSDDGLKAIGTYPDPE